MTKTIEEKVADKIWDRKEGVGSRRQRGFHHRVRQEDSVEIDMKTKFNFNSQI